MNIKIQNPDYAASFNALSIAFVTSCALASCSFGTGTATTIPFFSPSSKKLFLIKPAHSSGESTYSYTLYTLDHELTNSSGGFLGAIRKEELWEFVCFVANDTNT